MKRNLKSLIKTIIIFFLSFLLFWVIAKNYAISYNLSDSMKGRYFFIKKNPKEVSVNDLVLVYVNNLHTDFQDKLIIKKLVGKNGDRITSKNNQILINNYSSNIKETSKKGKRLYPISEQKIKNNFYYLYSDHKDGYDSRYKSFGLIHKNRIFGKAYEVF